MILFNSWPYIVFLAVVTCLYWAIRSRKAQNLVLLGASLLFYGSWSWKLLFLLLFSTSIDFYAAQAIRRTSRPLLRKTFLVLSVGANLTILGVFKYFNFFIGNFNDFLGLFHTSVKALHLSLILPIGISFYTFQAIGYCIDVYRGTMEPERRYPDYVLFIVFFPQLVAGPIERAKNMLSQFHTGREFSAQVFFTGLDLILWGLLKKVVIADNIGYYVDRVFALKDASTLLALAGAFAYGIQIFSDFSGYTDIARGSARLLGFELTSNFNAPYLARNPSDFWRRWHISLSNFVRDYIYIPLGGDRLGRVRYVLNILAAWFLMGLWHGASWLFILWGLFHGAMVAVHRFFITQFDFLKKMQGRVFSFLSIALTYGLVNAGWLLFRAGDWSKFTGFFSKAAVHASVRDLPLAVIILLIASFYSIPYLLFHVFRWSFSRPGVSLVSDGSWRIVYYTAALLCMLIFGELNNDFIYFQF